VIRENKSDAALTRAVLRIQKCPSEQGGGGGFLRFLREEAEGRKVSVTS
jgi:hypothetical protein